MDVADWLRSLGLERYEQAFRDNEIDAELLPNLTGEDLKDLGVALVGHRRRLLDAIARLRLASQGEAAAADRASEAAFASAESGAAHGVRPALRPTAERRQLTVLFCDLVGSTALSARLDPEDMRSVIGDYQNICSEVIRSYEGHVAKFMGDGVLAYFGFPRAHEDDAERAVRTGLVLVNAVSKLTIPAGEALSVRIGIATGPVVVGDLIGEGASQEQAVVGETPNLAARLQGLARPGSVVIAAATQRLVAGLFKLIDLGEHELRGFGPKVQAWQVQGESRAESRFQARSATGLTPFVGRQHELGMLLDRFEQAKESEGQVVLLSGEPGIGKSRLAHSLLEHLAAEPHTRVRYYCSPFFVNSALHPIIEQLVRAAGFEPDDPPERRLDKLEALLSQGTNEPAAVAPLVAALLSIPVGTRYPPLDLPAQRQRELTIAALLDQVSGLAARRPVLMIVEDGHWLDPSSTELFERIIERIQTLPVLVLVTFRPEFQPPWTSYPHMTSLTLNRLGRRHSTEMIAAVAGGKPLPEEVLAQIWAKTEGVPLFVEELTKTVLESGLVEDKGDRFVLTGPLPPLAIPATLRDSLMARLDRLAPVKEVAQIGAVIGREFPYRLLAALSPLDEITLQDALSHLIGAELVFRRGIIPDAVYSFKHAFVQDAAYGSLLKSKRQQLHAGAAAALREHLPEVADSQPELLAHHCTEAGLTEEAISYWKRAGHRAAEGSAHAEAAAHLSKGLDLLRTLPESEERSEQELDLLTSLGSILISIKGHGSPEVAAIYTRARDLCRSLGDTPHLVAVLQGQRMHHMLRAEVRPATAAAEELLALGKQVEDTGCLLEGHRAVGVMHFYAAEFAAARMHLETGIDLYDSEEHRSHVFRYEGDPGQSCLAYTARTLWVLGYPDQAVARSDQAIAVAQATAHAATVAEALTWRAEIAMFRGEIQAVAERASVALTMATEHALPLWTGMTMIMQGWALSEQGRAAAGVARIREGLATLTATGDQLFRPYYPAMMAEVLGRAGQREEGLLALEEAAGSYRKSGVHYWDAELQRIGGELRLAGDGSGAVAAEACFLRAIETAQAQCAKSLELRAATRLARLWRDRGKHAEARDLLAPVYGWFTEGFDTADLKDAKTLLDELR
jgi:class 3 adenylate cyclase/predicted ATPase